jgi:hypothetical protein
MTNDYPNTEVFDRLGAKGAEFLGVKYPIISGA